MRIPHFQLYGEGDSYADPGFVHIETIASRSRSNHWEIQPHGHDTLDQLLVIRTGEARARIEREVYALTGPAVIHVPAGTVHGFAFASGVDGDVLTFSSELRGTLAIGALGATALVGRSLAMGISREVAERLDPLLAACHVECSGHEQGRIAAAGWLVGLLLLQVGRAVGSAGDVGTRDGRAATFRHLVDRYFREHRTIGFYAAAMAITERSLTRLCRARFDCSPAAYIHRRLLLEARRQLAYGSQPIARIAEELGFADASYFTRFYRRVAGELPSATRGAG